MSINKSPNDGDVSKEFNYLAELLGWVDSGPLIDRLQKLWSFWTELGEYPETINHIVIHESGHAIVAFLFAEVKVIEVQKAVSGFRRLLFESYGLNMVQGENVHTSYTPEQVGAYALAGIAMGLIYTKRDMFSFKLALKKLRYKSDPKAWMDVAKPYRLIQERWRERYHKDAKAEQVEKIIEEWIKELTEIFSKSEYSELLKVLRQGILKERQILDAQAWMKSLFSAANIPNETLDHLRAEIDSISIDQLISKTTILGK